MHVLCASQAPHYSRYNGGTAPDARQYFLRSTTRTEPGPQIDAAIAGMAPGEMRVIPTDISGGLFRVQSPTTGAYDTLDWNPQAAWHPQTQQVIVGGKRIMPKLTAYSDLTGRWRQTSMPAGLARTSGSGHWYGMTDVDPISGRVFLGGYVYNPADEAWSLMAPHVQTNGGSGSMYTWIPTALNGAGGLIKYGGDARRWMLYDPVTNTWPLVVSNLGNGQHALLKYHPVHDRTLIVGGSYTRRVATLVENSGASVRVADCPGDVHMDDGYWIVPHPAGCWLVRIRAATGWRLYAYWPTPDRWDDLGPSPDAALTFPTSALDPARGIVLLVAKQGLYALKLPEL